MGSGLKDTGTYQFFNAQTGELLTTGTISFNNFKEDNNMEERLNEYLEKNAIDIDENGNFEMYVVVDEDDKDHTISSIFHGKETEVYSEKRAYEDLKGNNNKNLFSLNYSSLTYTINSISLKPSNIEMKKKTTIKDDLMLLEDKMFRVLVNKENVTNINTYSNVVYVNKYKVIEEINLYPELKFKIQSINKDNINVILYNSITEKAKTISIDCTTSIRTLEDVTALINAYLENDDNQVNLMNSIADSGAFL